MANAEMMDVLRSNQRTQDLLTQVLLEREEGIGSSTGAGETASIKGAAMVMKNRQKFFQQPLAPWIALELAVKVKMSWEEGESWSLEAFSFGTGRAKSKGNDFARRLPK